VNELEAQLDRFLLKTPTIGKEVFLARGAAVIGDVTLGDHASVWYNAVLRGDLNRISVGHHSNVQDCVVVHVANQFACEIGDYVTIGHGAHVHACTIGEETLIGMGSTILDGAAVGRQCMVGAGALITQGASFPDGSLILGAPAKVARPLTAEERNRLKAPAEKYAQIAAYCLRKGMA
jgi:carbonic anhydrase/acetyltransferase-like protein (isoleucine patch superfamily)